MGYPKEMIKDDNIVNRNANVSSIYDSELNKLGNTTKEITKSLNVGDSIMANLKHGYESTRNEIVNLTVKVLRLQQRSRRRVWFYFVAVFILIVQITILLFI